MSTRGGGCNIPLDTNNENQLGLIVNVEVALLASDASQTDLLTLSVTVLLHVGFGALEDNAALLLVGLDKSRVSSGFNSILLGGLQMASTMYQPRKMVNKATTSTFRSSRLVGVVIRWLRREREEE